jgi:hypothetical protein
MAIDVQIKCINKTNRTDPHDRIHSVGGTNPDGKRWKLTTDQAIAGIDEGKWRFYTSVNGKSVWVIIATHNGHRYLKTEADGVGQNNLLALPECP